MRARNDGDAKRLGVAQRAGAKRGPRRRDRRLRRAHRGLANLHMNDAAARRFDPRRRRHHVHHHERRHVAAGGSSHQRTGGIQHHAALSTANRRPDMALPRCRRIQPLLTSVRWGPRGATRS